MALFDFLRSVKVDPVFESFAHDWALPAVSVAAGDIIVVGISSQTDSGVMPAYTVSDNASAGGNTYTAAAVPLIHADSRVQTSYLWAVAKETSASLVLTALHTDPDTGRVAHQRRAIVGIFEGAGAAGQVSQLVRNGTSSVSSSAITTTSSPQLLVAYTESDTAPAGWSAVHVTAGVPVTHPFSSAVRMYSRVYASNQTAAVETFTPGDKVLGLVSFVAAPAGDTTAPTITGSITIGTVTSTSIQMSWPAGADNVAVTSYEVSSNGGSSYADVGNVLTHTFTGLTASTSYGLRVRPKDAAGNVAVTPLSATQSTSSAGTAPNITAQPTGQSVVAGSTATFSVTATGTSLTYQWRRNGSNISGAVSSSYTTPATTVTGGTANNGDVYSVVVTGDTAPAATSSNATLTVSAAGVAPSVTTNPSAQTVTAGATATFTAAATGTPTPTVQWQRNGTNISGATSTSYTTPATTVSGGTANNGDTYRAVFTNASGSATTTSATLTVNAAVVAGFDMHTATGCVFGAISGALVGLAREVAVGYKIAVYDATTRALIGSESATLTTDSNGRLPRFTNAACTVGVTYDLVAKRQSDGAVASFRLAAS